MIISNNINKEIKCLLNTYKKNMNLRIIEELKTFYFHLVIF